MYDIRGKYPKELTNESAYQIGRGFIHYLRKQNNKQKYTIGVGRDTRLSSPKLFSSFAKGVRDEGSDVVDFGLITTPMLYFGVRHFKYDGGAVITASHNPNPYNGIKLVQKNAVSVGGNTGIFWIRDWIEKSLELKKYKKGAIVKKNIENEYLKFNLKLANVKKNEFKGVSIAIDAGNGIGGPMVQKILKHVGVSLFPLYMKPDGRFPNHAPDPLIQKNLKDLISLVKKKKPLFGVALDGDADRIAFITEKGVPIRGDLIEALIAEIILKKKKGVVLYSINSSNTVKDVIKLNKGKAIPSRIGHSLVKEQMRKSNAVFAGELSGHYYFGSPLFFEVPFVILLLILKKLKNNGSLEQLIEPLRTYAHSGELNFKVTDKEKKLNEIKKKYAKKGKVLTLDGLRVDFKDWWFLVRPSNTENLLRLIVEANSKELMNQKKKELIKLITS